MKFKAPMLVVENINESRQFYCDVLGLRVIVDFGENITFTGGVAVQTKASWRELIDKSAEDIVFGGNNIELYFEEQQFDAFVEKLNRFDNIHYLHKVKEQFWGQQSIRFYDPDRHIIEVAEPMEQVCLRLIKQGLSVEQTAKKTLLSVKLVQRYLKEANN